MVTKKMTEDERRSLTILYKIAATKKRTITCRTGQVYVVVLK